MTKARPKIGDFVWHVHRGVLCQPLTESLAVRRAYIKENKSANEIPTRLLWMTPVRGRVPAAYDKAWAAYDKAGAAYDKAVAAWVEAGAALDKAGAAAIPGLEQLHATEHLDCPWDGHTLVFPKTKGRPWRRVSDRKE